MQAPLFMKDKEQSNVGKYFITRSLAFKIISEMTEGVSGKMYSLKSTRQGTGRFLTLLCIRLVEYYHLCLNVLADFIYYSLSKCLKNEMVSIQDSILMCNESFSFFKKKICSIMVLDRKKIIKNYYDASNTSQMSLSGIIFFNFHRKQMVVGGSSPTFCKDVSKNSDFRMGF